ncbi:hypothetical protein N7366_25860 [Aeromonas caviae]|jgi:hypothetical protein|uniref:hypothetical protein n=1 Tax=Aeromonas caviae TaxID=648 RepID=UPI000FEBD465|nr:hypothetical protein [Aeromonas caviae]MDH0436582.1 hypothetical protein [Aeromonas caviae]RWT32140.1 hypothetical protein DN613_22335 [Aeromonas caviae]
MAKTDLTTNSYHTLNSLDMSIRAFVEFAHVLPEEDRFAPLLLVLADRIESDFTAMRNDTIRLLALLEEDEERA